MNAIEWTFKMIDRMSGPAKTASRSMGDLIQTTHSALASIQLIGQAAVGAGRLIASGLEPAISREKSLGAFETLLGTAEKARDMYGQAVKFAAETPFETAQVVDSFQRLLTARFSQEEVPIAMRIIGDAASMQEDSQMAVASVTRALSQIRSKGKLQGEELMQLQEAVPLNTAELYERLGKIYGTNAQAARKMQEAGQIDSQVASFAILAQLQQQFGGNMERASKQIEGLVSTLRSRPSELLSQLQDTRGYSALSGALSSIIDGFSEAGPAGQALQTLVNDLGSGTLERVAVALEYGAKGAASFAAGLAEGLGPMGEAFGPANATNLEKFTLSMNQFGTGAGQLASAISTLISPVQTFFGLFYKFGEWSASTYGEWLYKPLELLMTSSNAGLFRGQKLGASAVRQMQTLEEQGQNPYARLGGPSEDLQQELLRGAGTGYEELADIPAYGDGGHVTRPHLAIVGDEPETIIPDRLLGRTSGAAGSSRLGGFGGGIQISMPITINGMSESGASSVGQSIMAQVEPALLAILERWQLQAGRA